MTGRHDPHLTQHIRSEPLHYPGAAVYNKMLMKSIDFGEEDPLVFEQRYMKVNRVCFQGRQFEYNWNDKVFDFETAETGHWGRNGTYEGCRQAREGRDAFLSGATKESKLL